MTLKEEICKYAGIITENVTPEQLGDKLSQLLDKGASLPELVKVINHHNYNYYSLDNPKLL